MYLYIMSELIFIGEKSPEGGFVAKCVSASIFTQADSIEKLKEAIIEGKLLVYLKGQSNEIFDLQFFFNISNLPGPLTNGLKYFRFWLSFR